VTSSLIEKKAREKKRGEKREGNELHAPGPNNEQRSTDHEEPRARQDAKEERRELSVCRESACVPLPFFFKIFF
jgi:hypothetical protein